MAYDYAEEQARQKRMMEDIQRRVEEENKKIKAPPPEQIQLGGRQQGQSDAQKGYDAYQKYKQYSKPQTPPAESPQSGSGGSGGPSMATGGWIALAIIAQLAMSENTGTYFEGVKTGGVQNEKPHFGTEPWKGFAYERLGLPASSGERFDAAIENEDYQTALARTPAMMDHWGRPVENTVYDIQKEYLGEDVANVLDPVGWLVRAIGGE